MNKMDTEPNLNRLKRCLLAVGVGCGLLCIILLSMLVTTHLQLQRSNPLESAAMAQLITEFDATGSPEKAEQIRQLDWLARRAFFSSRRQMVTGNVLLAVFFLLGAGALVAAGSLGRPAPGMPGEKPSAEDAFQTRRKARMALLGLTAFAAVTLGVWSSFSFFPRWLGPELKDPEGGETVTGVSGQALPAEIAQIARDKAWPGFRGWGGLGVAEVAGIPEKWNGETGENLRWKVPLDLPGFSSPVIWEDKVFLTAGDADTRVIQSFSLLTGDRLWQHDVVDIEYSPEEPPEVTDDTGYAAPSPAVSADAVCAVFANGDLVCTDHDGKRRWGFNLGVPANHYGHSSSLLIDRGVLFVQFDHSEIALLMAYDVQSGNLLWEVERTTISWGSPVMITAPDGNRHLVLVNESTVCGYDPRDGSLLWREDCLGGEVAPSAAYDKGIVFVANEYAQACGVRIDSEGASQVLWTWDEELPDVASPVAVDGKVYLATSAGVLVCLKGDSGTVVWQQEFDTGFYSSPIVNRDRLILADLEGVVRTFGTGDTYELKAEMPLGDPCFSTPALVNGAIVFRTRNHLYCFGSSISETDKSSASNP